MARPLRQQLDDLAHERLDARVSRSADSGTIAANARRSLIFAMNGSSVALLLHAVDLVDGEHHRERFAAGASSSASSRASNLQRLDHPDDDVDALQRLRHGCGSCRRFSVARCSRLEARRVDEHELGVRAREDPGDAMARGLGLARGDADLLPDEEVQQRRLADVGAADDRDVAGAVRGSVRARSCLALAVAARRPRAPPPARRCAGSCPRRACGCRAAGSRIRPRTALVRLAARGDDRIARQRQAAALQVLLQQRLGVLAGRRRIDLVERVAEAASARRVRAASKPPSRNAAPTTASTASASIDGRRAPPLLQLAFAEPQLRAEIVRRATAASEGCETRLARSRESSPSVSCGKLVVELERDRAVDDAVAEEFEALVVGGAVARCVSARSSRSASLKR